MILHITTRTAWQEALPCGEYRTPSLETEGFIHCSTPDYCLRARRAASATSCAVRP